MQDGRVIGRVIKHYRIERLIGQGGMAAVYEASDLDKNTKVAVKLMHSHLSSQRSFRERFLKEAELVAQLQHPNIICVTDWGDWNGELFIAMEYIDGGNLRKYVKDLHERSLFLNYAEAIEIIRQTADALNFAHRQGKIHRDIKPDNILLRSENDEASIINYRPVIADFGLAKLTDADEEADTDQEPIGTYPYMSPEQCDGLNVDHRTDIYALGIMLYELVVGHLPYNPKTIAEASRMHGREPLPLPSAVRRNFPTDLEQVVIRCLEKSVEKRYQSADQIVADLEKIQQKIKRVPRPQVTVEKVADTFDTDIKTVVSEWQGSEPPIYSNPPIDEEDRGIDHLIISGNEDATIFAVKLIKPVHSIGRYSSHNIHLQHLTVSRHHGRIERKANGKYYIVDTGSTNGTWLDGEQLQVNIPRILSPNSSARIGDYWLQLLPGATFEEEEVVEEPQYDPGIMVVIPPDDEEEYRTDADALLPQPVEEPDVQSVVQADVIQAEPVKVDQPQTVAETKPEQVQASQPEVRVTDGVGQEQAASKAVTAAQNNGQEQPQKPQQTAAKAPDKQDAKAAQKQPAKGKKEASVEPIETGLSGIIPLSEKPPYTPPSLDAYQLSNDRLIFYSADQQPMVVALDQREFTLGRSKDADIVLDHPQISLEHAKVTARSDGSFWIADLNSTNGVWIDQQRLAPNNPARLVPNKTMRVGPIWAIFETKDEIELDLAKGLSPSSTPTYEPEEDDGYVQDTVGMVRPLPQAMPNYEPPALSAELRNSDRLFFFSEDHPMRVFKLEKEAVYIGRGKDPNIDISLAGKKVSRRHMLLKIKSDGKIYVTDLESTNGVWIDDILLVPNTEVVWLPDETIRIGNYWLRFETRSGDQYNVFSVADHYGRVGKVFGEYRIDYAIGDNPISALYKATESRTSKDVALKFLHTRHAQEQTIKQRFLEEARVMSRLQHPNMVRVLTYNTIGNEAFVVMELIKGITLREHLRDLSKRGRNMEYDELFELAIQMCEGLYYAHQQGLVHRDIRPESVMLKASRHVGPIAKYTPILTDFTLLRFAESGDIYENEDRPETVYPYMSPEQLRKDKIDLRSDIYEIGIILYEMLVGRPPYQPKSIAEAVRLHAHTRDVPRMAEFGRQVPDELEKIILKCLDKDPNNRYQTAADLNRALQRVTVELMGSIPSLQSLVSSSGFSVSAFGDPMMTQVMPQPIPSEMPLLTNPYRKFADYTEQIDRLLFYSETHPTDHREIRQGIVTIGRGDDQTVRLPADNNVSRRHLRLERGVDGHYRITDLGSKNGTWIGDRKLIKNVTEVWEPSETLRVGSYWVRLAKAEDVQAELARRSAATSADEEYKTDPLAKRDGKPASTNGVVAAPAIVHPPPAHDRIVVKVTQRVLEVEPGGKGMLALEITNQSDLVDHFRIEVVGIPAAWFTVKNEVLELMPVNRGTSSIEFHPPLASTSSAGAHAFEIRVSARAQRISAVRTQDSLIIKRRPHFTTSLYPDKIKRRGNMDLVITNDGNTHGIYTLQVRDREQMVRVDLSGKQYKLPPGHSEQILLRVAPRRRHWLGKPQVHPFEVVVTPTPLEEAGGPQAKPAELTVTARIAAWMLVLMGLLVILLIAAAVLGFSEFRRVSAERETATFVANSTQVAATQTALALFDEDQDSLPNIKETEIGTFANLTDTDEDGLNDGEEVRVWLTNPLNRDTDGDGIPDGEEVENGSDPLKRDTDDDGIPDGDDIVPETDATPTVTPFPTIPGSLGDICPGSPIPSRLSVGMRAKVESGGVDNRLRADPNLDADIVGYMAPGTAFLIVGGPFCDETAQIRWWQVQFGSSAGWTAEGEGEEYYLCPPDECDATPEAESES